MSGAGKSTKKDGNSSFLNSLLDNQQQSPLNKSKNKKKNPPKATQTIRNYFSTPSTSSQNESEYDERESFLNATDSTILDAGDMPELVEMVSVLESRKKSLEEKKSKISEIKDEQIKNILLDIITDMTQFVEDSDKILKCQNELISRQNDDSYVVTANSRSINNLSKGIGSLVDSQNELKNRVQSLETTKDCILDSQLLNIILVDQKEADEIESGAIGPKEKFAKILSDMKIMPPKETVDAKLITTRRFVNGNRKLMKILKIRFGDSVSPGYIIAQMINHNKELSKAGQQNRVKYYVETPTSKNVWLLKRICYELKNDGILHSVRGCDRGILVSYKIKDQNNENKSAFRSCVITSEKDIDELRVTLKVEDAYVPVREKYNDSFWSSKKKPEMKQKRAREIDEIDLTNSAKKGKIPTSTPGRD